MSQLLLLVGEKAPAHFYTLYGHIIHKGETLGCEIVFRWLLPDLARLEWDQADKSDKAKGMLDNLSALKNLAISLGW
jgi:hypothetical protein